MRPLHVIMPVKDSLQTATEAVRAICKAGLPLTVFNDFSTAENTAALQQLAGELHFTLVNLQELTDHPSPNYLLVLQIAQRQALADGAHLVIVESDVIVRCDTVMRLAQAADTPQAGLVAAVTTDDGTTAETSISPTSMPAAGALAPTRHASASVSAARSSLSLSCVLSTSAIWTPPRTGTMSSSRTKPAS